MWLGSSYRIYCTVLNLLSVCVCLDRQLPAVYSCTSPRGKITNSFPKGHFQVALDALNMPLLPIHCRQSRISFQCLQRQHISPLVDMMCFIAGEMQFFLHLANALLVASVSCGLCCHKRWLHTTFPFMCLYRFVNSNFSVLKMTPMTMNWYATKERLKSPTGPEQRPI